MRRLSLFLLLALTCIPTYAAKKAAKAEEPAAPMVYADSWTLRKFYTVTLKDVSMDFAEDNAELRVRAGDAKLLQNTSFSITLGDGRVITGATLPAGECGRDNFTSDYGNGTHYTVVFPPNDNLQVTYRLTKFSQRPFVMFELSLANLGQVPVQVKEMLPLIVGAGGLNLGENSTVTPLALQARGGSLVVDPAAKPLFNFVANAAGTQALAFGLLPQGRSDSGMDFEAAGGALQGNVYNRFSPALSLAPNEKVTTDALWFCFGMPVKDEVNLQYSWTLSTNPHQGYEKPTPKGWLTARPEDGVNDLVAAAGAAKASGLKFALIPGGWESRPGSLQGAAPRYPREIAAAARALRDADLIAGLTIDPLGFEDGGEGWSAKSADGKSWLNLGKEEARAVVQEKLRGLIKNGFEFFVVSPSAIPDEVLTQFNLTRAAADALALQAAAAAGAPVFPAFAASLEAGDPRWAAIQADTKNLRSYKVLFGPTRMSFGEGGIPDATAASLKEWPGPIEVVGAPPGSLRSTLQPIFRQVP